MLLRSGLQGKFILFTGISIIVFMFMIGFIAVQREKKLLYREVERRGRLLGDTLAIPIINDLIYERLGLIEEGGLLDNYIIEIFQKKYMDFIYISVIDEKGRVISHNDITEYGKLYNDSITINAIGSSVPILQHFLYANNEPAIDFAFPLSIGKKRWGTLKFGVSLKSINEEISSMILRIIILTALFLITGFGIILFLSQKFIKPIINLANVMEGIRGDLLDVRVPVKGNDEIAILTARFNSLLDRIKEAQDELRRTHEKLRQSERLASIGILASGVAHEINNPLGGIFNCLEILKKKGDNPELRAKYIGLIKEGLERIETIVNRLLYMAGKREHKPQEINIRQAVQDVYGLIEFRAQKMKILFENNISSDLYLHLYLQDFQQVMLNLFINALQAMNGGGSLVVNGLRKDSMVVIEVRDTGIGIKKEHLSRIFDPFFTTKPPGEGTGLGLWLTYEIVKSYNGEIRVESEEGRGSKFILEFPLQS